MVKNGDSNAAVRGGNDKGWKGMELVVAACTIVVKTIVCKCLWENFHFFSHVSEYMSVLCMYVAVLVFVNGSVCMCAIFLFLLIAFYLNYIRFIVSLSWVVFFSFHCICFFPSFFFSPDYIFYFFYDFFSVVYSCCCCWWCSCYFIEKNQVSWMSLNRRVNAVILEGWYKFPLI